MGALSDGLPRFAALISFDEDKSTTIYRRFDRVAARDLLRMESELAWLEAEQDFLDTNIPKELKEELGAALISTQEHRFHANYEWEQDFDVFCTSAEKKWQEVSTTDTFASPGETWKESLEAVYELSLSQKDYKAEASELGRDIGIQLRDIVLDASARALRSSLYSPAWIERLRSVITESEIRFEPLRPDDLVDNIKGWTSIEIYGYNRYPHFKAVFGELRAIYQKVCQIEFKALQTYYSGDQLAYACNLIALRESARRVRVKYAAKERLDVSHKISSTIERYCRKTRLRRD